MDFLVSSCEQHPMLRDGTVLRSSAVTIGTTEKPGSGLVSGIFCLGMNLACDLELIVISEPDTQLSHLEVEGVRTQN